MLQQAISAFVQEARDILEELEDQLLALEDDKSPAKVDEIFRALHTIKGSGAMFGYTCLSQFTHHFEGAFELVRAGSLPVESHLIDLCFQARDMMAVFLDFDGDSPQARALVDSDEVLSIVAQLKKVAQPSEIESSGNVEVTGTTQDEKPRTYRIMFRPEPMALEYGMRPDLLLSELSELGEIEVIYDVTAVPQLSELNPKHACLGYEILLNASVDPALIEEIFIFADAADLQIEETGNGESKEFNALCEATHGTDAVSSDPQNSDSPAFCVEVPEVPATDSKTPAKANPVSMSKSTNLVHPARKSMQADAIRVPAGRIDDMMDSLGELVIAQARLDAEVQGRDDPALEAVVEEVSRLVVGLRDATLSIRMMPIETVFGKFRRVVRDLAAELEKDVKLVTEGGETELDKNVIDRIGEPIVHMIRNSVDHGIETTEQRRASGKNGSGIVKLSACQEGGEILISIEDNGVGLDTEAIRNRALDRGMIEPDDVLSESALQKLVFEPGFSTTQEVTSVSGRGVGMDAVKTVMEALGGTIDVISKKGQGTRVTLRLPVTLAIIDGLRVRLGESVYVVPLSSVEECVELAARDTDQQSERFMLEIRNEMVPYLKLEDLFSQDSDRAPIRRVVIVRVDGVRVGLMVDDILGQGQTVIKSLSSYHSKIPGLGGATIMGDGRVALIIDVATLVRSVSPLTRNILSAA